MEDAVIVHRLVAFSSPVFILFIYGAAELFQGQGQLRDSDGFIVSEATPFLSIAETKTLTGPYHLLASVLHDGEIATSSTESAIALLQQQLSFFGAHAADMYPECLDPGPLRGFVKALSIFWVASGAFFSALIGPIFFSIISASALAQDQVNDVASRINLRACDLNDDAWDERVRFPILKLARETIPALTVLNIPLSALCVGFFTLVFGFVAFTVSFHGGPNGVLPFHFFGAYIIVFCMVPVMLVLPVALVSTACDNLTDKLNVSTHALFTTT